ncbi:MAG TPA: saccharopine dehydrogenase NADP-binding domain-containing protein, partial [Vicinamibacteria bacterium]|nr:saccharopine dehydrogenase NADP-binding domain-containing protein [Vicinamibacteria bacterium]
MSAAVFGGYGVFGSQVARELARLKVMVTVAGRDRARAETLAAALGPGHRWVAADATDAASCRAALAGASVAVHCAGPFSELGTALHAACLEAGVHAVDIADDRRHAAAVRSLGPRFRERGLAAVWGASSLPGLSGALATLAGGDGPPPDAARVVLFIGND